VLDLIERGGFLMFPLMVCSILALAIVIERAVALANVRRATQRRAREFLAAEDPAAARRCINRQPDFLSRMLRASIAGRPPVDPDEPTRQWGRRLPALATIATVAPLLGLLGTVTGMIAAFQVISAAGGTAGPADLAGGIWEALLTTAAGLFVAIPCYVAHGALAASVNRRVEELEAAHERCLRSYRALETKTIQTPAVRRRVA
jgi:biopolymer transport protein ExbB